MWPLRNRTTRIGRWLALLALALAALPASARTCLVLGGGGARGAAHVGVLQVLERERIPVDCVVGTSMGGIVGALYATGYDAAGIAAILDSIDWHAALRDNPGRGMLPVARKRDELRYLFDIELGVGSDGRIRLPAGMIQGQQLELLLRRLFLPAWHVRRFEDLPIPFRTIATDIVTGERVVLDQGDLAAAVRATMSVPGAFAPVRLDDRLLVDGGVVENVPLSLARALGATRMIAVDVGSGLLPESALDSPLAVTYQTLSALMLRQTEQDLATLSPRDILIRPQLGDIGSAAFERVGEAVPAGVAAAEAALPRLREMALDDAGYAAWRAARGRRSFDPPLIAFLEVLGDDSRTARLVANRLSAHRRGELAVQALEDDVNTAYAAGDYARIGYHLVERDGATGLAITPQDKRWGPGFLRAGLSLSDDFRGRSGYQLSVEGRWTGLNTRGAELRGRLEAGLLTGGQFDVRQPFGGVGQYQLRPFIDYRAYEQPVAPTPGTTLAEFRITERTLGIELGWTPSPWWQVLLRGERGDDRIALRIGDPQVYAGSRGDWGALVAEVARDTLDSVKFPRSGSRTELGWTWVSTALGASADGHALGFTWDKALSRGRHSLLLGVRGRTTFDDPGTVRTATFLGGLGNLSGLGERELFGLHGALARMAWYRRLGRLDALFSVPAYLGVTAEYGGAWLSRDDIGSDSLIAAGSVFIGVDSPLGPIFLGYGHNDLGLGSMYLRFGSLLRPVED